jgi:DNA-binding NtrC family response regulator
MRETLSVAVLDPNDPDTIEKVTEAVKEYQSSVIPCSSREHVLPTLNQRRVDVVVIGFQEPFRETFDLLSQIKTKAAGTEVVFLAEFDDKTLWVWIEAIQRGAYEFLPKAVDLVDLRHVLLRATEKTHPVRLKEHPPATSIRAKSLDQVQSKAVGSGG